jgi:hypothetical protein
MGFLLAVAGCWMASFFPIIWLSQVHVSL